MAVPATSSSSYIHKWNFDVFLSFRGEDSRYTFTGNLYNALRQRGIYTFIDDAKLRKGEEISPALLKAIKESRICIVVFSENYANSTWCLDELVKILECKQTKGQFVHPVFYKVDPSDIRKQKSCIGEALALHEKRFDMEKVQKWRLALLELANLSGSHVKNLSGYEFEFILRIIEDVTSKLDRTLLHVANHPVGLESRIIKVSSVLESWSHDEAQMLGIYGLGGIGKTTLARAVYNHIANRFECKSFLANVRENSTYARGLVKLQKKLLFEMLGDKDIDVGDVNEGVCKIKHKLQHKKVLLVLDDVEKIDQLRALVGGCNWFGPGSKIIMTTRDKRLLEAHGVDSTHQIEELDDQEAFELFCWNAFKRSEPNPGYEDISMRAIRHGKNLPLVLEIIGSDLYGKGIDEWKYTLDKYERVPNKEIHNILRISYDSLDYTEKQIFLDIACFFKGMSLESCKDVFCACDFYPDCGIRVLFDKSLINIKENMLWMHDLIQEMGRLIVQQDPPLEPGKRSRLWFHEDALQVLTEDTGSDKIEGIMLSLPEDEKVHLNGEAFSKMKNLRILIVENAYFFEGPKYLPNSLRVLDWKGYPSQSLPPNFHPTKLVILNLPDSCLTVPELLNYKKYENLVFLNFSHCESLKSVPDVSRIPNLVELHLDFCKNLVEVHDSVGFLNKLVKLSAQRCYSLKHFSASIKLAALEYLNLRRCSKLDKFPHVLEKMEKIRFIDVGETAIKELPSSFGYFVGLEILCLVKCRQLSGLPNSFLRLQNLKELDMERCSKVRGCFELFRGGASQMNLSSLNIKNCNMKITYEELLIILGCFTKLKSLNLSGNSFATLPASIKELHDLEFLELSSCNGFKEISAIPANLKHINALWNFFLTAQSSNLLLSQGLNEIKNLTVSVNGGKIPDWFDHQRRGGSLSFRVRQKFPAIVLCSVYGETFSISICFQIHLFINGIRVCVYQDRFTVLGRPNIWLHDPRAYMSSKQWEDIDSYLQHGWNHVEVSFMLSTGKPKWCGVHVYKKESDMTDVQFTSLDLNPTPISSMASDSIIEENEGFFSYTSDEAIDDRELESDEDNDKREVETDEDIGYDETTILDQQEDSTSMINPQMEEGCKSAVPFIGKGIEVDNYTKEHVIVNLKGVTGIGPNLAKLWARGNSSGQDASCWTTIRDKEEGESKMVRIKTLGRRNTSSLREQVKLPSSEAVKRTLKFTVGRLIFGGKDNIIKNYCGKEQGEKVLKASQCCLYTTAGLIGGILYISTGKVVFLSQESINENLDEVVIPIGTIKEANQGKIVKETEQKYIEIITEDYSKFRFLDFHRYEKTFRTLQKAISLANESREQKTKS